MNNIKGALLVGLIYVLAMATGILFAKAIDASDRADCRKWQLYAKEYPAFYVTPNEAEQCRYWNIAVEAPVKRG